MKRWGSILLMAGIGMVLAASNALAQFYISVGTEFFNGVNMATVTMENSVIRVSIRARAGGYNNRESNIQDFVIKPAGNYDIVDNYVDANAFRGYLANAVVTYNGADRKTVRCTYFSDGGTNSNSVSEYTIYPNSPYVKIFYESYTGNDGFSNIVDILNLGDQVRVHGQQSYFRPMTYYDCSYWNIFDTAQSGGCGIDYRNTDPPNGGPLNYFGYFIMAYGEAGANGRCFGRIEPIYNQVVPGAGISILKIFPPLFRGFEPYNAVPGQASRPSYTGYIFALNTGVDNAISYGRSIVDNALPVQLASFSGSIINQQGHVQLDWTTLTETNNYGFEVEKSRVTTTDFRTIPNSFIRGQGTTLERHDYRYVDVSASPGVWFYRLKQTDLDGTVHYSEPIRPNGLTDVKSTTVPASMTLEQNYPNPFNPSTRIRFALPINEHVKIEVLNLLGQQVATLVDEERSAGFHEVTFNSSGLASGSYLYKLVTSTGSITKKLVVLK